MISPAPEESYLGDEGRLASLRATLLLDSAPEAEFDRLTRLASRALGVPVALTSLVDDRRQFFKACLGLPDGLTETPLSHSFCQHVVRTGEPLVIGDAREDPLLRDNLAIPELGVIAYLGIPLVAPDGHVLGSFCAIDHEPRDWSDDDVSTMDDLAHSVMTEIALREEVRTLRETEAALGAARDAAEAASRSKSDFVAHLSHEVRNPLNGVLGMLGLLEDSGLTSRQRDYVRTARSSGEALLEVVNDVLDFSKVDAGRLELDAHDFDLRELIEDTCEMLAAQAHAKGVELVCRVDPRMPPVVRADAGRWRQVLTNLGSNAIKFTQEGHVAVRAGWQGDGAVEVEVVDTGIGIAPERIAALFEPFAQADASTSRRFGGTGLGLAISRRIVALMGGELTAESSLGDGSAFRFTAPVQVPDGERPTRTGRAALPAAARVLIAARGATGDVVAEHLAGRGLRCASATTMAEALAELAAAPFDLVVLDADAFGAAQAERVREAAPLLVALTRAGEHGDVAADDFVAKPPRRSRLLDAVAELLTGTGDEDAGGADSRPDLAARVLVADDSPVNQLVISAMLAKRGVEADVVGDGSEVAGALARGGHAAVLMDCQMPGVDGFEATAAVRAGGSDVPIIAMTADAMAGTRERCLRAGMDDYIAKPIREAELEAVLERWVGAAQR